MGQEFYKDKLICPYNLLEQQLLLSPFYTEVETEVKEVAEGHTAEVNTEDLTLEPF